MQNGIVIIDQSRRPFPGFFFVDQANYTLINLRESGDKTYLYSDSATSCIIAIVAGLDKDQDRILAMSHLDRPQCLDAFFNEVVSAAFVGPVAVWAQGANPPCDKDAMANRDEFMKWICDSMQKGYYPWYAQVEDLSLALMGGDPRDQNRGNLGVDLLQGIVTNQPFDLTLDDRDPMGGPQTLFSIFAKRMASPLWLRSQDAIFPVELVAQLVCLARASENPSFMDIYLKDESDEQIREQWSTTPQYEAPWFSDELRQASEYAVKYPDV